MTQRVASARAPASRPLLGAAAAERLWRFAPLAVGALAFALGLVALRKQELSYDETVTVDTASGSVSSIWHAARETEAPHLVYYLLMKPWLALAGTSAWAARFPAVVFGALAAAALTVLATRLLGRGGGLVAGAALATAAYVVHWSQQARGYTLAMLLAMLATLCLVRALEGVHARWWAAWALCLVAAAWVSLFAVAVLAAHVATLLALPRRRRLRAPALALAAAVAAIVPIVALVAAGNNGQLDWIPAPTPKRVAVQTWDWSSRNPFLLVAAAAGAVALVAGGPRRERWQAWLVCAWLAAPFVLTLLLSAIQPAFESRYLLSAAPALALLVGAAWAYLPRRLALPLVVLVAVGAGFQLAHLYVAPGKPFTDLF